MKHSALLPAPLRHQHLLEPEKDGQLCRANKTTDPILSWRPCMAFCAGGLAFALLMPPFIRAQDVTLEWAKQMGGTLDDEGWYIAVDAFGNVYTTGHFQGTVDFDPGPDKFNLTAAGGNDIYVSKSAPDGNFIWAKRMGGVSDDRGLSLAVAASGNVYVTGRFIGLADFDPGPDTFNLVSVGSSDIFISALDADGNLLWAKRIGGAADDRALSIAVTSSGNVYTTGWFSGTVDFDPDPFDIFNLTSAGSSDIFISKLDDAGNFVWAKRIGGNAVDIGYFITVDASGDVFTTGVFRNTVDFDPGPEVYNLTSAGNADIFLSKLDPDGNFVWAKRMGGLFFDGGYSIGFDALGNIYTTGEFQFTADFDPGSDVYSLTSAGSYDIFVSKLDPDGNFVWAKRMGGTLGDLGYAATVDAMGNVYVTGSFQGTADFDPGPDVYSLTSAGNYDVFICKLDSDGNFSWAERIGGSGWDDGLFIAIDAAGSIHIVGVFQATLDFDPDLLATHNLTSAGGWDIFILKLNQSSVGTSIPQFFEALNVYPNPAGDYFTLHMKGEPQQTVQVELFGSTGQVIFRETLDFQAGSALKNYSCRDLPPGFYLLHVRTAAGTAVVKVAVQR
ncbi:MAG: T9SS type A sorting domain-containing protein [Saprospiraceae bacterium]|nr:T9SS type A sorting domain-containing protein [Saprospiraceae bacterium]